MLVDWMDNLGKKKVWEKRARGGEFDSYIACEKRRRAGSIYKKWGYATRGISPQRGSKAFKKEGERRGNNSSVVFGPCTQER